MASQQQEMIYASLNELSGLSRQTLLCEMLEDRCKKHNIPPLLNMDFDFVSWLSENQDQEKMRLEVLPSVVAMAQDVSDEVRAAVSICLDAVAIQSKECIFKTSFINIIVDLLNDTSSIVRRAAFDSFSNILNIMPEDVLETYGITIAKKFIVNGFSSDADTLIMIAFMFGKICLSLSRTKISEADQEFYFHTFNCLASIGVGFINNAIEIPLEQITSEQFVRCRLCCINSFPDMLIFCERSKANECFSHSLKIIYCDLMTDINSDVRKESIWKLDQVFRYYFDEWTVLVNTLHKLTTDPDDGVLNIFLSKFGEVISEAALAQIFTKETDHSIWALLDGLLQLEQRLSASKNYRLYVLFLAQMEKIIGSFEMKMFLSKLVSKVFKHFKTSRGIPKILAMVRFLLVSINHLPDSKIVSSIRQVITGLGMSHNSYDRSLFLRVCYIVLELFSITYFKTYFFNTLVILAEDRVPNVRLGFAKILPNLNKICLLSGDNKSMRKLNSIIQKLEEDNDRDVQYFLSLAKDEIQSDTAKLMNPFLQDKVSNLEELTLLSALKQCYNLTSSKNEANGGLKTNARQSYFSQKYAKIINKGNKRATNTTPGYNNEESSDVTSSSDAAASISSAFDKIEANNNEPNVLSSNCDH